MKHSSYVHLNIIYGFRASPPLFFILFDFVPDVKKKFWIIFIIFSFPSIIFKLSFFSLLLILLPSLFDFPISIVNAQFLELVCDFTILHCIIFWSSLNYFCKILPHFIPLILSIFSSLIF